MNIANGNGNDGSKNGKQEQEDKMEIRKDKK